MNRWKMILFFPYALTWFAPLTAYWAISRSIPGFDVRFGAILSGLGVLFSGYLFFAWASKGYTKADRSLRLLAFRMLRLLQDQVKAMNNGPMGDLNYAGIDWLHRVNRLLEDIEQRRI